MSFLSGFCFVLLPHTLKKVKFVKINKNNKKSESKSDTNTFRLFFFKKIKLKYSNLLIILLKLSINKVYEVLKKRFK